MGAGAGGRSACKARAGLRAERAGQLHRGSTSLQVRKATAAACTPAAHPQPSSCHLEQQAARMHTLPHHSGLWSRQVEGCRYTTWLSLAVR